MDTTKFIENLKLEITATTQGIQQVESLERLKKIAQTYNGDDKIISFKDIEEVLKQSKPIPKISSKISALDTLLCGGFMKQTVTTISATPKAGKTSFCMFLTTVMTDKNPLWLALEESAKSLIRKMMKNGLEVPNGFAPKNNPYVNMKWVEDKIVESIAKYDTEVVFIDQLDFIVPQDGSEGRHDLKVADTMRRLHQIAVKWNVAIFLICHLEKIEPDVKPTTKNLRGSSSIWGEADNCIFLWRECFREAGSLVYTKNVLVSLQANREDGETGDIQMVFDNGKFLEQEWNGVQSVKSSSLANW